MARNDHDMGSGAANIGDKAICFNRWLWSDPEDAAQASGFPQSWKILEKKLSWKVMENEGNKLSHGN